ncbi:MAG: hypothetical protein F4W96_05585 [Chloroflexi bacterium]|nr:hypothetical protein [Chloroflexota bacterium]
MSSEMPEVVIACNEAEVPSSLTGVPHRRLEYRGAKANVAIGLPAFVRSTYHLPARTLDILEIAAYVFAADRLLSRGKRDALEYHSWSRRIHFEIKIRDHHFWSRPEIRNALHDALTFMMGHKAITFAFQPGHTTPPADLFDYIGSNIQPHNDLVVGLFSGGLDSLAGAVDVLQNTGSSLCLVTHVSQSSTLRTQKVLINALAERFPDRVHHYQLRTHLKGQRARDETQRSRAFLYSSAAYAIASTHSRDTFAIYENGVTSINVGRRDDLINARASRTTHPQTVGRLSRLFSLLSDNAFSISTPFFWKTKREVISTIRSNGHETLVDSSVSCSHTFNTAAGATHCGECYQCIDRRIGVYGAGLQSFDTGGIYANDVVAHAISTGEGKTTIIDYLRQASKFASLSEDAFYLEYLDELSLLDGWVADCADEFELTHKIWDLAHRHGQGVHEALRRIRQQHESLFAPVPSGSLLSIISDREFLKEPIERLVESVSIRLSSAIPIAYQSVHPKNETDLNDKIEALLAGWRDELRREHPEVPFAGVRATPDFSEDRAHLRIEGKYLRGSTNQSKVVEAMSADLVQYSQEAHILFVVYDPNHMISDRGTVKRDFEGRGRCSVCILP